MSEHRVSNSAIVENEGIKNNDHDEERSGWQSAVTDELMKKINEIVCNGKARLL